MVRRIDCGRYAEARIWIDELPTLASDHVAERNISYPASQPVQFSTKALAIEILWPTGPRSLYGVLSAEFIPAASAAQLVRILVDTRQDREFSDSMALLTDNVRIGLIPNMPTQWHLPRR